MLILYTMARDYRWYCHDVGCFWEYMFEPFCNESYSFFGVVPEYAL